MTPESADIQPVGAGLSRDISKGEAVEADLEAFITRRHDYRVAKEGHRPSEEMYEEGTRRYQEQMRATARVEWHLHHVSGRKAQAHPGGAGRIPRGAGLEADGYPTERSSVVARMRTKV